MTTVMNDILQNQENMQQMLLSIDDKIDRLTLAMLNDVLGPLKAGRSTSFDADAGQTDMLQRMRNTLVSKARAMQVWVGNAVVQSTASENTTPVDDRFSIWGCETPPTQPITELTESPIAHDIVECEPSSSIPRSGRSSTRASIDKNTVKIDVPEDGGSKQEEERRESSVAASKDGVPLNRQLARSAIRIDPITPPDVPLLPDLMTPHGPGQRASFVRAPSNLCLVGEAEKSISKKIQAHVQRMLEVEGQGTVQQDLIYCGAGLERLLKDAKEVKPKFDELGRTLAKLMAEICQVPCSYLEAPVKSQARAAEKTNIEYLGDASKLKDAVRGTLVVSVSSTEVMGHIYDFLHILVIRKARHERDGNVLKEVKEAMRLASAEVKNIKDRYVKNSGEYADWNVVLEVVGMLCELQINFDSAIQKKDALHEKYEVDRKLNARLLQACLHDDSLGINMALLAGAKAREPRDANGLTPLHYTAAAGNHLYVEELLQRNADPMVVDNSGDLPLNQAVRRDYSQVIHILIAAMQGYRLQLSTVSETCKVALLKAWSTSQRRGDSYAEGLYKHLFDVAVPADEDKLHYAARAGDSFACVSIILEQNGDVLKLNKWQFRSDVGSRVLPLDDAILAGSDSATEVLVSNGATLHYAGPHRDPQHAAEIYAREDRGPQISALLAVDSNAPNHCDDSSVSKVSDSLKVAKPWGEAKGTPLDLTKLLDIAVRHRSFQVLRVLIEDHGMKVTDAGGVAGQALREAVGNGQERLPLLLLEAEAAVDSIDEAGNTALWFAAAAGDYSSCDVLLDAGAIVDRRCSNGSTAAWMAAFCGRLQVLQVLHKHGADLDIPSSGNGMTPANMAAEKGYVAVVEFLRGSGADLSLPQQNGFTPLATAVQYGHVAVVKLLADAGFDLHAVAPLGTKYEGHFALSIAVMRQRLEIIRVLIDGNVDVNQSHLIEDMTALDYAESHAKSIANSEDRIDSATLLRPDAVVKMLQSAKAKPFEECERRRTSRTLSFSRARSIVEPGRESSWHLEGSLVGTTANARPLHTFSTDSIDDRTGMMLASV